MTRHDKLFGDIPDRYEDTTPVSVKIDYVNKAEKRVGWNDFAGVDQLHALLQPRIDSAGRMAEAWERYLLREALRLGCWRIWFVQWTSYEGTAAFLKTKVFPPWGIKAARAFAKEVGEHVVGLSFKKWLLYVDSAFNHYSGASPNKDAMADLRRVMRARCIMKCMPRLLRYKVQAKENPTFKAVTRGIFEDMAIKKEYLGAFDKISHGEAKDDPG